MKKFILILLSLCLTLGLAGCSAPKSDAELAYLEAQKSSSILPGKVTASIASNVNGKLLEMNLEGTSNSEGSFLLMGEINSRFLFFS